jgi:hypothetical protein
VKDSFDTIQSTLHGLGVVDVSLNELDLIGNFIEVFAMAGAQIVQNPHLVTSFEQSSNDVRPDKTTPTGDKTTNH